MKKTNFFTGDTLIKTTKGLKRLDKIKKGDEILNVFKETNKIIDIKKEYKENIYEIKIKGLPIFYFYQNSNVLTSQVEKKKNRDTKKIEYYLLEAIWEKVCFLNDTFLVGVPYDDRIINDTNIKPADVWLFAKFLINGYHKKRNSEIEIIIENTNTKFNKYEEKLKNYKKVKEYKGNIYIQDKKLNKIYKDMEQKSHKKSIPQDFFFLPDYLLRIFLDSLIEEIDDKNKLYNFVEFPISSKKLAYQLIDIINKAFKKGCNLKERRINKGKNVPSYKKRYYLVSFNSKKKMGVIRKNIEWKKVEYIRKSNKSMYMYGLTVENDNQFIGNNIILKGLDN